MSTSGIVTLKKFTQGITSSGLLVVNFINKAFTGHKLELEERHFKGVKALLIKKK